MDVLNQNERKSAQWRIFSLVAFIMVLLVVSSFAMRGNFELIGMDDYGQLEEKIKKESKKWVAEKNGLDNKVKKYRKKLEDCKKKNSSNKKLEILEKRLKDREEQIEKLEEEIEDCEDDLKAATNF